MLESYIFRSDEVGQRIGDALIARRRARRERAAAHSTGSAMRGIDEQLHRRAAARRASSIASSTRPAFAPGSASCRAITASCSSSTRRVGITGGVGIGDEWTTGMHEAPPRSLARHRRAHRGTGGARHAAGVRHDVGARATSASGAARTGFSAARRAARISIPPTDAPALVGIIEGEPLRLRVSRALQIQAISAERSIWIATAYFAPSAVGGRSAQRRGARRRRRAHPRAEPQRPPVGLASSRAATTAACSRTACASGSGRAR